MATQQVKGWQSSCFQLQMNELLPVITLDEIITNYMYLSFITGVFLVHSKI
jgi:hypothetical protein